MPKISKRAQIIPYSPMRKFLPYAEAAKRKGIKIYHLNIGQPDLEMPSLVYQEIRNFKEKILPYGRSQGEIEFIQAWQKYFKNYQINFSQDEIIITAGGSEAIIFAMTAVCDPGEEIIVFEPLYANYNGFACLADVKLKPISCSVKNGFRLPKKQEIEKKISPKTKAILICNPNNPTGTVYTKTEIQMLVDLAKKHHLFILSDEVYREFIYTNQKHQSIAYFPKIKNQAILLDSVSKRFNACGARIGCLCSKNKEINEAVLKFTQARLSPPYLEQKFLLPILNNSKFYLKKVVNEYKKRREVIIEVLSEIPGVEFKEPEGAFYIIAKLPVDDADKFAKWLLTDFNYQRKTIMIAPGSGFYATEGLGKKEIRIAWILNRKDLAAAMDILKRGLEEYRKLLK
ncbi:MAG: pyridoxal phosphate-dependent aminotransferase [Patescibacteria group bacterium]